MLSNKHILKMKQQITDRYYLIFVLPIQIDEINFDYFMAIDWANSNTNSKNVLSISLDDVYLINDKILTIINEENDSMIGPFEDGFVISNEVKGSILQKLKNINFSNKKEHEINKEITRLIELAIEIDHLIYFVF